MHTSAVRVAPSHEDSHLKGECLHQCSQHGWKALRLRVWTHFVAGSGRRCGVLCCALCCVTCAVRCVLCVLCAACCVLLSAHCRVRRCLDDCLRRGNRPLPIRETGWPLPFMLLWLGKPIGGAGAFVLGFTVIPSIIDRE